MVQKKKAVGRPKEFDREQALKQALQVFWEKGYVLASVGDLCGAMKINAPSLYAAFGNKRRLFLEALEFYESTYWALPVRRFAEESDVRKAVRDFFAASVAVLCSQKIPCGCLTVLAAVSINGEEREILARVRELRGQILDMFAGRFERAVQEGQLAAETNVSSLALAMNTLLEGLSVQTKNGADARDLDQIPLMAVRMLG